MSELYWITVLGKLSLISTIATITLFVVLVFYVAAQKVDQLPLFNKFTKTIISIFIACLLATISIPSTKELYFIYGVGSAIDYLQESPEAKQLPDKTLKCLNQWCNEFIESHEAEKCSHND